MSAAIPGSALVPTTKFALAQHAMKTALDDGDIAVLSGPPGCGKTFAVEHFLAGLDDGAATYLEMPPRPAPKEVAVRLYKALSGKTPHGEQYVLTEDLVDWLHGTGHLLVIDEAHNLGERGLQYARYLHNRGKGTWSLVLVGSRIDTTVKSAPELKSRSGALVRFDALAGRELMAALRDYHPLLRASDPKQLRYVDEQWGHGVFRSWYHFTKKAVRLAERLDTHELTDKLISATLAALGADEWQAS